MFESADLLPPDAIFGLNDAFNNDPSDSKINLTTGVYKDENGTTPLLKAVADAEKILADKERQQDLPADRWHACLQQPYWQICCSGRSPIR